MKQLFIYISLHLVFFSFSQSQTSEQQNLDFVRAEYELGNYSKVLELTENIQNLDISAISKRYLEKIRIATYFEMDSTGKAIILAKNYLKKEPNFICNPFGDIESFCNIASSFETKNRLELGIQIGASIPIFLVKRKYFVINTGNYTHNYKPKAGFDLNAMIKYRLDNRIYFQLNLGYFENGYKRNIPYHNGSVAFDESDKYINSSLSFGYEVFNKKIKKANYIIRHKLDLGIGFQYAYQVSATANIILKQNGIDSLGIQEETRRLANFDLYYYRNQHYFGLQLEQRWTTYINQFGFSFGISESFFFNQSNDKNHRYLDPELALDYYYVDDDYSSIFITPFIAISYVISYKTKSIRKIKAKL